MKSWNEIRKDAAAFAREWVAAYDEKSQAQSFLKDFFGVFGVNANKLATFESRVKLLDGSQGYIDLFWKGVLLVEMKSAGKDLDAAFEQAKSYTQTLPAKELPRAILVSDFQTFRFYDLAKDNAPTSFKLADLRKYVTLFGFMIGGESEEIREQDPVNRKAAEKMARLHDALKAIGYQGRELEIYLVRLLFCLFAEDTSIFQPGQFTGFIRTATAEDGNDLAIRVAELFQVLNTPPGKRLATLNESVAAFPYVNGNLFGEMLPIPAFSAEMRRALLDCGELDWSKISPAIFGAMFQGVMDETKRHDLGAHYTSEENILKVIRPLFLDRLREEFDTIALAAGPSRRVKLNEFHDRIAAQKFLDPACGCGNFLLVAYRELRRLEMDVLEELHKDDPGMVLDVSTLCKVDVSQFYGIEIEQFPAEIAKVALWLMDHLCNLEVADRFGQYFARIPIKASPHIVCANALATDWGELLAAVSSKPPYHVDDGRAGSMTPPPTFDYIFGNPPFLGRTMKTAEQQSEISSFFDYKDIDFVACWYAKANDLIQGTDTRCAFVSTNSITQGEQVAPLWRRMNAEIDFAYRTFKWHNEAKDNAAVHCVIIGFHAANGGLVEAALPQPVGRVAPRPPKTIYDGDTAIPAKHINGYLMDAPDVPIESRSTPICDVPPMCFGNMPLDGGNLIIEAEDYGQFVKDEPQALPFIKPLVGSREFLNRLPRYCLWLDGASPALIAKCPLVKERIEKCRAFREASKAASTRKLADTAALFRDRRNPSSAIIVPSVSSERRHYVPIGFVSSETIVSNLALFIPSATLYHFGVLTSRMHNAWMRAVCGRLKSDYRYSKDVVYNNFVWPSFAKATEGKPESADEIAAAAQAILDVRARYLGADPECTLAILYNPETMPPDLVKAHAKLDALVDKAYGLIFADDAARVAHLFKLYAEAVKK